MNLTEAQLKELAELADTLQRLPASARAEWLAGLGPEQALFRPALQRLLVADGGPETQDFLATLPKVDAGPEQDASGLTEGAQIGPYRLLRELGRGGMGTVWLAERSDGALTRTVALKLPHSVLAQRRLAERFARERDILAALTHANIARLYDAGISAQGQPYLALEYVEGEPLLTYCDGRRLELRARIELLLQALTAVQYAHGQLIVHRDLKPSNILVTAQGEVRLLDFGIAKLLTDGATQETELTQVGGRLLTPKYASPEQIAGGPIGIASDVYALGVILYEMLTGVSPYRVARESRGALEDAILTVEPMRPSQVVGDSALAAARGTTAGGLRRDLKGDLDTIALKALKKGPAERYATADAFAADLRRFLAGKPVQARPDSAWYRAHKFVVRNRLAVGAAALVLLALGIGLGVALWQTRVAQQEAVTAKAVEEFLEEIFKVNTANQSDPQKARQTTARELLDIGASRIDVALGSTPKAKSEVLHTLATLYSEMGLREKAIEIHRKQLASARQFAGPDSLEVAEAMLALCTVMGRGFTATDMDERKYLLADTQRILDQHADNRSILRARLFIQLSWLYLITDAKQAYDFAARGVELYRGFPADVEKVEAITSAAVCLLNLGRAAEAKVLLAEALAIADDAGPSANAGMPLIHISMGLANMQLGELAAGISSFRTSYDYSRKLNGADDASTIYAQRWLGDGLIRASKYREAIEVLQPAVDAAIRTRGADDTVVLPGTLYSYGVALAMLGRVEEAFEQVTRAIDLVYPHRRDQTAMLETKAGLLTDFGRYSEAEILYAQALRDREQSGKLTREWLIDHWNIRVKLLIAMGRSEECLQFLAHTWPLDNPDGGRRDPRILWMVARAEFAAGDLDRASSHAEEALNRIMASPQREYQRDFEAGIELLWGKIALGRARLEDAQVHLTRARSILESMVDPARSPKLADTEVALGQVALAKGKRDEAIDHTKRADAIYRTHPQLSSKHLSSLRDLRAALHA